MSLSLRTVNALASRVETVESIFNWATHKLLAELLGRPRRKRPAGGGVDWTGPTEIKPMIDRANARVNTWVDEPPEAPEPPPFFVSFSSLAFALVATALVVPTINVMNFDWRGTEYPRERSRRSCDRGRILDRHIEVSFLMVDQKGL
ncbi:hypothetical protein CRG98_019482 [Punica granatum]|uniref:Uncharacterized protein n=1 Tax=Punica granatum TaxID=22663 RepID=A0A2I0JV00_PUNGR|nr:hypothetical protein CRG98_019482 [Punica granatum]